MQELNTLTGAPEGTTYPAHIIALKDAFKAAVLNVEWVKDGKKLRQGR